jgi:hypothetical protein
MSTVNNSSTHFSATDNRLNMGSAASAQVAEPDPLIYDPRAPVETIYKFRLQDGVIKSPSVVYEELIADYERDQTKSPDQINFGILEKLADHAKAENNKTSFKPTYYQIASALGAMNRMMNENDNENRLIDAWAIQVINRRTCPALNDLKISQSCSVEKLKDAMKFVMKFVMRGDEWLNNQFAGEYSILNVDKDLLIDENDENCSWAYSVAHNHQRKHGRPLINENAVAHNAMTLWNVAKFLMACRDAQSHEADEGALYRFLILIIKNKKVENCDLFVRMVAQNFEEAFSFVLRTYTNPQMQMFMEVEKKFRALDMEWTTERVEEIPEYMRAMIAEQYIYIRSMK